MEATLVRAKGDSRRIVFLLIAAAFAVRTADALRRPFHTDERFSLQWAGLQVKDLLMILRYEDVHPPLYFLLLHVLGLAHAPDWIPRMLMVGVGTASVALLYFIVRIWAGDRAAAVAGIVAAFAPVLVFYDTWIRMYVLCNAFILAEFLLLSILLTRDDLTRLRRWLLWLGWVAAAVVAGYTLYVAWFAVLAQLLYVALLHRRGLLEMGGALAGAIALWLPQVATLLHQMSIGGVTFQGYRGHQLAGLLSLPAQATIVPQLEGTMATVAAVIAWLWVAAGLWAVLSVSRRSLLPWLGVPAVLTFAYGVATHKLIYLDRYYMFLAYALAAWTGCLFVLAIQKRIRGLQITAAALVAGVAVLGIAYAVDPAFYTADWPSVARALAQEVQPHDLILMEQGMPYWTLADDKDITDHPHMFIFYPNQIPKALAFAKGYRRVWVMAYEPRGIDRDLVLLRELGKKYRLASVHQFNRLLPAEDVVLLLFVR